MCLWTTAYGCVLGNRSPPSGGHGTASGPRIPFVGCDESIWVEQQLYKGLHNWEHTRKQIL